MTEGRCLCGAVRYEIDPPLQYMVNCHCSMCRKHHGSSFATVVTLPPTQFRWVSGEANVGTYASSEIATRAFCKVCGSVAPVLSPKLGAMIVPAGNLDGDPGLRPQVHIFTGSKAPWYDITDALPQAEAYPPGFEAPTVTRDAVDAKGGVVQGSCLCGDVAYEVTAAPMRMVNCHCSRCRRGRSAAHATNLFYGIDAFRWTRGEQQVADYQLPEAKYFGTAFCRRCGSEVPRLSLERGVAVVPAGSLDQDPGVRPALHIYVSSMAPWFEITDDLPRHAELPPSA
jgi:hypothetical protein